MIYILIILLLFIVLLIVFLRLVVKGFSNPQRKHESTPADIGIDFREIQFATQNNRTLYGWHIQENPAYPTLILVHGWGRNVGRMLPYIKNLYGKGFNLLAFDSRHHGSSDRDNHSTMKKFAEDISAAVDYIFKKMGVHNTKIGVVGLSIGGAASIYAAAHDERIGSVVTVGAFANPLDLMKKQLSERHIPYSPLGKMAIAYLQHHVGFKFEDIAPEKHIAKAKASFLLIHGEEDVTVPVLHAKRLQASGSKENTTLWVIPGRGHSNCHLEERFWDRITAFFNDTLK